MRLLMKRKVNAIPVGILLVVIIIGTAAGAFLWISNLIDKNVTVTDIPIQIQDEYMEPPYTNSTTLWLVNYTINEMSQSSGYIWISIWAGSSITTSEVNINSLTVETDTATSFYGSLVAGYPQNTAANLIDFMFEDSISGGQFDFSDGGIATNGDIWIYLVFNVTGIFNLQMQITSTL